MAAGGGPTRWGTAASSGAGALRRRGLWLVVLGYAALAVTWLVFSETVLASFITQPDTRRWVGSVILVATAGLLTLLIGWWATRVLDGLPRREPQPDGRARLAFSSAAHDPRARDSAEQIAGAVCAELLDIPDVVMAEVISLPPGDVTRLAFRSSGPSDGIVPPPIPAGRAAYLVERSVDGPWLDEAAARRDDATFGAEFSASGVRTVAYWPLQAVGDPLGVVAVGTRARYEPDMFRGSLVGLSEIGALASALLVPVLDERRRETSIKRDIEGIIATRAIEPVFQPIVRLETREVAGYEAFTRFEDGVSPEQRFGEAARVGLGLELEEACLDVAVDAATQLPGSAWISFNVSPQLLTSLDALERILPRTERPVVIEMTEQASADDYSGMRASLDRLAGKVRLAVDEAGAEFMSRRHILELRPQFVKIDRHLVRDIDLDLARQALIVGMRHFARETDTTLIAEGIETEAELQTLRALEVPLGQGYLFGRPAPAG
jgi:EAL domain-containing protein (putative c-di-GMP-specific phosphodiesterase class I)